MVVVCACSYISLGYSGTASLSKSARSADYFTHIYSITLSLCSQSAAANAYLETDCMSYYSSLYRCPARIIILYRFPMYTMEKR